MTTTARQAVPRTRKSAAMKPFTRRMIGAINFAEAVLTLVGLVAAYGIAERLVSDQELAGPGGIATRTIQWWGPDFTTTLNMSLLILGAAAGAVGSVIQQSMIFAQRAGLETLERGYVWWYLLRPVWSALLGSVVVVAVNTGLISIGDETTSEAGVAVLVMMGCLAGLFTDQALRRLRPMLGATPPEETHVPDDELDRPDDKQ
ncbi:hypothetical protein [Streptomyces sp. SID13031]|uniref:hypothetical protein n=1 Tax=Streptomyces sp. SID13031 TaxID=2706046 RepID=UPI0013CCC1FB|nr:hypothetical protein [Streptomyces sp. SID13031]NEA30704.1 hypothetical protein [Streptomyces sp. SID13031]